MESILYTCILGNYDTLKEPRVITPGWRYICYTDQDFKSEVWEIVRISGDQREARRRKILFYETLPPHERSIWVDGSFTVNVDLNHWWERVKPPMTAIRHPLRQCVYQEAEVVVTNGRKGTEGIRNQARRYREAGLPAYNGLIQSGILMRYDCPEVRTFCAAWWEEMESLRDQVSFAYIVWKMPIANYTRYDYRTGKEFIFKQHNRC